MLSGYKWFSSATDAEMALVLAKVKNQDGTIDKSPSLFALETHKPDGSLNGLEVVRLKDKMGTRPLPTAEVVLNNARAFLLSDIGRGIPAIGDMLNITRLHTAISAVSYMRRIIALARSYGSKRKAFGKTLLEHPLHAKTLGELEAIYRGCLQFVFEVARLQGLV